MAELILDDLTDKFDEIALSKQQEIHHKKLKECSKAYREEETISKRDVEEDCK